MLETTVFIQNQSLKKLTDDGGIYSKAASEVLLLFVRLLLFDRKDSGEIQPDSAIWVTLYRFHEIPLILTFLHDIDLRGMVIFPLVLFFEVGQRIVFAEFQKRIRTLLSHQRSG